MMMGFGFVGLFLMLAFWGIVIVGAIWLIRSIFPGVIIHDDADQRESLTAREIIDQRFARGEITREHYLGMIDDLEDMVK